MTSSSARQRPISEMVAALRRHVRLLEDYGHKLYVDGRLDYAGEVAGKIRLLTTEWSSPIFPVKRAA
jgi:hypothetical protein